MFGSTLSSSMLRISILGSFHAFFFPFRILFFCLKSDTAIYLIFAVL